MGIPLYLYRSITSIFDYTYSHICLYYMLLAIYIILYYWLVDRHVFIFGLFIM